MAAVVSGKKPQTRGKLGTSSVPFPSLPPSPGDDQPTPPQAGSIFSNLIRSNPALSPPVSGIVPRADRRGQVRRDVGGVSLPLRRSRKIALQGFDIVNQSEWRGRTLDEVAAVTARGRASATFPRIIDKGLLPPSLSSDDGKPASTISDYPTLTQSTPATSVELLHDHKRETGALTSNPGSTFEASNDAQALDAESAVRKVPMWETKETVGGFWDAVRLLDRFSSNRDRRRKLRWNVPERNAEEDWKWAKTEGKKPVGGRRLLVVSKPAPAPTAFISSQAVDDEWNDSGLFDEDTQKAILMSMGIVLEDAQADRQAGTNHQYLDNQMVGLPIPAPPTWVPSEFEVCVDEGGSPMSEWDEKGFSKSQQQQAKEASRKPMAMSFYWGEHEPRFSTVVRPGVGPAGAIRGHTVELGGDGKAPKRIVDGCRHRGGAKLGPTSPACA